MIFLKSTLNHVIVFFIICHCFVVIFAGVTHEQTKTPKHNCKFISNTNSLDCSNLNLNVIPKDIPNSIQLLNLSFNEIEQIDPLIKFVNLTSLDLSNNKIDVVSRETFVNLRGLNTLFLSSNKLKKIDSNTFELLENLTRLDLSHNNELELREPFLIHKKLVELNLDFCNIKDLPDGVFSNMSQLENLTLAGNPIDEEINTSAFLPLKKLLHLRIPNLKADLTEPLCETLPAIDVIMFDEYNISCLVLLDDPTNFNSAVVTNDPINKTMTIASISAPTSTLKPIIAETSSSTTEKSIISTTIKSTTEKQELLKNITTTDGQLSSTNKTKIDTDTAQIDIDTETINMMLLVILGVTMSGLLIGLICRIDICGIKTKLCRSKKSKTTANNRREPIDTVSAFEEIPLNTINKSAEAEGQG